MDLFDLHLRLAAKAAQRASNGRDYVTLRPRRIPDIPGSTESEDRAAANNSTAAKDSAVTSAP